ncbi:putative lipase [Gordonia araii NBRC 100433]|uniref:Putative lipase n=1 Tax=Gordonia araii NBRC 100433 TaxID=1073574 RepID=G7H1Y7_9ACTN|nr:lipase family protein [Gordonia araii]NNG97195.1 triacylglycerol lipase [Gordonia araii NBRC 100433]GAB09862.1 putative lipase [Gordonia araii NBRC 100433]
MTTRARRSLLAVVVAALTAFTLLSSGFTTAADAAPSTSPAPSAAAKQPRVQPVLPFPVPPALPEFDRDFYLPAKSKYKDLQPGELIAARRVNLATYSFLPLNVDAWLISYRSTNSRGEAIPAVATVAKPKGPRPHKTTRVLSFQIAEDGTALYCSPSYQLQMGSIPSSITGSVDANAEGLLINSALASGWTLVIPDHQGPDSAYAAGPLAGRITLDGVRAAQNFNPLRITKDAKIAMTGYSGGAIATGWAAELHKTYAPELNVVGAAMGGVPADISDLLNNANNNLTSGLIMGGMIGVAREYPELERFMRAKMNPLGQALVASKNPMCLTYHAAIAPFINIKGLFNVPGDPMRHPTARKVLDQLRMGRTTPEFPMLINQAVMDEVVPVGQVDRTVRQYCSRPGAQIEYVRDHFSEHVTLAALSFPSSMVWLNDRFNGKPAKKRCSRFEAGTVALNQKAWPAFANLVGDNLVAIVGMQIGQPGRR